MCDKEKRRSETVVSLMLLQAKQGNPEPLAVVVVVVPGLLYFPVPTLLSLLTLFNSYPTIRHC